MIEAYCALHHAGHAHSIETWIDGKLVGGLYCVALGRAFFGESMFSHQSDASKIALAALVAFARAQGVDWIDCQQNTRHLASLGGREIPRSDFLAQLRRTDKTSILEWRFDSAFWSTLLLSTRTP
jgi:leucyl/phenylalanyl-tRNA--protein transferase